MDGYGIQFRKKTVFAGLEMKAWTWISASLGKSEFSAVESRIGEVILELELFGSGEKNFGPPNYLFEI